MKKYETLLLTVLILFVLLFSAYIVTGKETIIDTLQHKAYLSVRGISNEEYCIQTNDFINRTSNEGICNVEDGETPLTTADCCGFEVCITQKYEWWC